MCAVLKCSIVLCTWSIAIHVTSALYLKLKAEHHQDVVLNFFIFEDKMIGKFYKANITEYRGFIYLFILFIYLPIHRLIIYEIGQ